MKDKRERVCILCGGYYIQKKEEDFMLEGMMCQRCREETKKDYEKEEEWEEEGEEDDNSD